MSTLAILILCVGACWAQTGPIVGGGSGSSAGSSGGGAVSGGPVSGSGGSGGHGGPILPMMPMMPHAPNAIHHVGVGYNLLKGNPDGEYWSTGGEDPGLLLTRKILTISAGDHPREVIVEHHDGCQISHGFSLFHGTKSYQTKLLNDIKTSGSADSALKPYAFMLSSAYQAVAQQTSHHHYVFQDATTYCKMGHVRYAINLAQADHFPVTRDFAASVCKLPTTYDQTKYMQFIEEWGTHIMTEATIGKVTTYRYLGQLRHLFNFVLNNASDEISLGGQLFNYPTSYVIDKDTFATRKEFRTIIGTFQDVLSVGDMYYNDVIGKTLTTLDFAFGPEYWQYMNYFVQQGLCSADASTKLSTWQANVIQALKGYAAFKSLTVPDDGPLAMPITWPLGTYALPKPTTGCPTGWNEGTATLKQSVNNQVVETTSLDGNLTKDHLTLHFCVKEDPSPSSQFDIPWPAGDYCVYKYGDCPSGFRTGFIQYEAAAATVKTGVVPDGSYDVATRMYVCCRNDSVYTNKVYLPTDKNFYMFKNTHGCQGVKGKTGTDQPLTFHNKLTSLATAPELDAIHPATDETGKGSSGTAQYTVHYCYYHS